jgi:hypothetical protein
MQFFFFENMGVSKSQKPMDLDGLFKGYLYRFASVKEKQEKREGHYVMWNLYLYPLQNIFIIHVTEMGRAYSTHEHLIQWRELYWKN